MTHPQSDAAPDVQALPPEAPIAMPVQSLHAGGKPVARLPSTPRGMAGRRAAVIGGAAALRLGGRLQDLRRSGDRARTGAQSVLRECFIWLSGWVGS